MKGHAVAYSTLSPVPAQCQGQCGNSHHLASQSLSNGRCVEEVRRNEQALNMSETSLPSFWQLLA